MGNKLYLALLSCMLIFAHAKAQCNADFDRNPNPACVGSPVVFYDLSSGGSPNYTWNWNFGAGATPATFVGQNPPTVTYSSPGTKNITLVYTSNNGGCSDVRTRQIDIIPQPTVTFTSNAPQCVGSQVNFTYTGSAALTYQWDFGIGAVPQASTVQNPQGIIYSSGGTKTVTLTIDNGTCTSTITQTILVNTLPVSAAGADTTICANTSVTIGSTTISGYTYNWFPSSTLSNPAIANPVASPIAPVTVYIVTVTDTITGCVSWDSIVVTMLDPLVANAGPDGEICMYDSVQVGTGLIVGQTYAWSPGAGLSNTSVANPVSSPSVTTTYTLVVTGSGCAPVTDEVTITVHPLPTVNAGQDDTITLGQSTQLIATGGVQYTWTPPYELNNTGIFNPIAGPDTTTSYIVTVVDIYGCVNSDTMTVRVIAPSFWIATAFSPDNNGHNDILFVRGEGISDFEFAVFDRWGEQLFYTKDLMTGWDGTKQGTGETMPEGAYVYFVKGQLSNGEPVTAKGMVNLIR